MHTPLLSHPKAFRFVSPIILGCILIGGWQLICAQLKIPVYLVPAPTDIVHSLIQNWASLIHAMGVTVKITLFSFVLAIILGVGMAFVLVQSRILEASLFPYAILLQVTPIVAIAPLIIIWVKNQNAALVVCATLVALFPIVSNTVLGLRSVNPGLANLFSINRANRWQTLLRLRIPSALPYFFGGLRISSGLALIGAVVAEFVAGTGGSGAGLAYQILQAGFQLDIPLMFAALALIAGIGVVLFLAMSWLSKLSLGKWHESEMGA